MSTRDETAGDTSPPDLVGRSSFRRVMCHRDAVRGPALHTFPPPRSVAWWCKQIRGRQPSRCGSWGLLLPSVALDPPLWNHRWGRNVSSPFAICHERSSAPSFATKPSRPAAHTPSRPRDTRSSKHHAVLPPNSNNTPRPDIAGTSNRKPKYTRPDPEHGTNIPAPAPRRRPYPRTQSAGSRSQKRLGNQKVPGSARVLRVTSTYPLNSYPWSSLGSSLLSIP